MQSLGQIIMTGLSNSVVCFSSPYGITVSCIFTGYLKNFKFTLFEGCSSSKVLYTCDYSAGGGDALKAEYCRVLWICKLAAFLFGCIQIPTSWSQSICNKTRGPHKKIMTMSKYFSLLLEAVRQIKIRTIAYRKQQSPGSLHRQHWYCDTSRYMILPLLTDSMDSCRIGLCEPAPTSAS